jgi:hypothetical protein
MIKDNRGMSLVEVMVSGAILVLIIYGIANFSKFAARSNQSNKLSVDFAGAMSSIDNVIKTPACDTLFSGISFDDHTNKVGVPQTFNGFTSLGTLTFPPPGFALTNVSAGEPPSYQLMLMKPAVDSILGTTLVMDTVDLQIALKKVDSTGKPMPGASMQIKDFTLNLWVDQANGKLSANSCTTKRPVVAYAPIVHPTCVQPGAQVTATWDQPPGNSPILTKSWGMVPVPLAPDASSVVLTVPSPTSHSNLTVTLTEKNAEGDISPAVTSAPFASYASPTVTASFIPSTFSTLPASNFSLSWSTTDLYGPESSLMLNGPTPIPLPLVGPTTVPGVSTAFPGQSFPYTIVAKNPCGVTATGTAYIQYLPPSPSPSVP